MVNSAEEAARFVSYLRYPPLGQRSFGPTRVSFAAGANYAGEANDNMLAFAMIETAEGMARFFAGEMRSALTASPLSMLGALLASGGLKKMRARLDPSSVNGGPLLGLNGIVVKSHGGTDAEGFAYAVDVGYEMARYDLLNKIKQMLNRDGSALVQAQTAQEAVS